MAPGPAPTRVLLADDHEVVRAGLAALLGAVAHIEVVGEAADGGEAIELAARLRPDVVLMDLSMPRVNGIEATRRITGDLPGTHVVMLTSHGERRQIAAALAAGAEGYLLKDCDSQDIIAAVASASRGEAPIDPRAADAPRSARGTPRSAQGETPVHQLNPPQHLRNGRRHYG